MCKQPKPRPAVENLDDLNINEDGRLVCVAVIIQIRGICKYIHKFSFYSNETCCGYSLEVQPQGGTFGPEVLSMNFVLLINLKLLTIANSFLLNITEHVIFSANKYENANNSWHFHIY